MGPLVTRGQQAAAFDGIAPAGGGSVVRVRRSRAASARRHRSRQVGLRRADAAQGEGRGVQGAGGARGRGVRAGGDDRALSRREEAAALIARGGGSLVASLYGEDHDFLARMVGEIGPSHGRLLVVDPSIAQRPYRPRHRHAAMQSRRPRPRRQRRGARRPLWPALLSPAAGGAGLDRSACEPAGEGGKSALTPHDARATANLQVRSRALAVRLWRRLSRQRHRCLSVFGVGAGCDHPGGEPARRAVRSRHRLMAVRLLLHQRRSSRSGSASPTASRWCSTGPFPARSWSARRSIT